MKKNKNHISAWFLWESLALLHCSFSGNNGCKMQSAGVRTKDADHRHLSHTNALCAVFVAGTGKHPTEQIFPSFCRCFGNTEKARATLLYSLFGESASIAFDWSRNARALPSATRRAEALHPLLTFFEKKVSQETLEQKGASIFEKQEDEYTHQRGKPRRHTPQGRASGYDLHRLRDKSLPRQTDRCHRRS